MLAAELHQPDGRGDDLLEFLLEIREAAARNQRRDQMDDGLDVFADQDGFQQLRVGQRAPVHMDGKIPDPFQGSGSRLQDGNDVFSPKG